MSEPTSQKPYLLRALYEWCVDNGFTPYIAVTVDAQTRVPMEYVRNGEIVLNIGPLAANKLRIGNEMIDFAARFGGITKDIVVPIGAVAAIYARENGQGMTFEVEASTPGTAPAAGRSGGDAEGRGRSHEPRAPDIAAAPLREIKPGPASGRRGPAGERKSRPEEVRSGPDAGRDGSDTDPKPPSTPPGGRPQLRRVK